MTLLHVILYLRVLRFPVSFLIRYFLQGYVLLLVELTVLAMFRAQRCYHDKYESRTNLLPYPVTFKKVEKDNFDKGLSYLFRYLVNFGFYRFGLEVSIGCHM